VRRFPTNRTHENDKQQRSQRRDCATLSTLHQHHKVEVYPAASTRSFMADGWIDRTWSTASRVTILSQSSFSRIAPAGILLVSEKAIRHIAATAELQILPFTGLGGARVLVSAPPFSYAQFSLRRGTAAYITNNEARCAIHNRSAAANRSPHYPPSSPHNSCGTGVVHVLPFTLPTVTQPLEVPPLQACVSAPCCRERRREAPRSSMRGHYHSSRRSAMAPLSLSTARRCALP
jgi:hypothetical protein